MSPHAANSLVHDLVEMARSHEELPQVRIQLLEAKGEIDAYLGMIQRLELQAIDRKNEIDALHSTIRTLEVSRDEAEYRFLEAEDRTEKALAFVRTVFGNAGQLLQALEPPKPEPKPEPMVIGDRPLDSSAQSQGEAQFTGSTNSPQGDGEAIPLPELGLNVSPPSDPNAEIIKEAEGQSEADPTSAAATLTGVTQSTDAMPQSAEHLGDATSAANGPYTNKRYHDYPYYVSPEGWLAGGGTEADYHWRPSPQQMLG